LVTGALEPTNEPYAIAKIDGIKMCEDYNAQYGRQYTSAMPTNLYGPNDNYDLADACVFLMERGFDGPLINIGTGSDVTIRELAETVMRVVGCNGRIVYDHTKTDGTPRKLMDSSQFNRLGWKPAVPLEDGVRRAYRDFLGR
jgi:GDP-L-fucose synthase